VHPDTAPRVPRLLYTLKSRCWHQTSRSGGRKIGSDGQHLTAYLTPKGNIAVVDQRGSRLLDVYDEVEAFIVQYGDTDRPGRQEMVREVARALGVKSVRELDI
jgi:hypothetical protein